jgi:hypothetical protein
MKSKDVGFFAFVVLMMSVGLRVNADECEDDYMPPAYVQYVTELTKSFASEMYKEYGFECVGSGGSMPYDVEEISVKLVTCQIATVDQARELEIKATERFVQMINMHEKIRPFLREHPFPSSRVRVSISFERPKNAFSLSTKNDVSHVFQARNRIFYQAKNPDNPYLGKDIKDEPYEEALKIVQANIAKSGLQKPKNL